MRQAGCDMHLLCQFVRTGDLVIGLIESANPVNATGLHQVELGVVPTARHIPLHVG